MNSYEDFNSKKFLVLTLMICVIFLVLIIKAFSYLPDNNSNDRNSNINTSQVKLQDETNEKTNIEDSNIKNEEDNNSKKELNVKIQATDKIPEIEEDQNTNKAENELPSIEDETQGAEEQAKELSPEEQAEQTLIQAAKYKKDKQYVKALEEYNKISSITKDTFYVAKSYEEIATIYAIVKRYGTALSFAQKAYNMSPSSSREMLLARLYYKTGDIDKATQRVNNVLQRDFAADR